MEGCDALEQSIPQRRGDCPRVNGCTGWEGWWWWWGGGGLLTGPWLNTSYAQPLYNITSMPAFYVEILVAFQTKVYGLGVAAVEGVEGARGTLLKGISSAKEPWPASDASDAGSPGANRRLESGCDISGNRLACQQWAFARPGFGSATDCAQIAFPANIIAI